MTTDDHAIQDFFASPAFAVVGASSDRNKYGNRTLRSYLQAGREVYAVNPHATTIEGVRVFARCQDLPRHVRSISIVSPPQVADKIVRDAASAGITHLWFQPGAESEAALMSANELKLTVIARGPCILVVQGFKQSATP